MINLGVARTVDEPIYLTIQESGWNPVSLFLTNMEPTNNKQPFLNPDAILVLSPSAARFANISTDILCLAQGQATAKMLPNNKVLISDIPKAEGILSLLQTHFPFGGRFIVARAEHSRKYLEFATHGTCWKLCTWITHREVPLSIISNSIINLDAVLGLSPLQAKLLGPYAKNILRFAWGLKTNIAFNNVGYPTHGWCEPTLNALRQLLINNKLQLRFLC